MDGNKKCPPREPVLVALHGDEYVEAYAERNIDIRIVTSDWVKANKGTKSVIVRGTRPQACP